jgi:uncharacterized membrane protein
MPMETFAQRSHQLFLVGIALKAANAILEILAAGALLLVSPAQVQWITAFATRGEMSEDPGDFIARSIVHAGAQFTTHVKIFLVAYLLSHGIVKLLLVWQLYRQRMWAYPVAIVVFALFMVYQLFEMTRHFSIGLVALTVLDAIIIVLTWNEYGQRKRAAQHVRIS